MPDPPNDNGLKPEDYRRWSDRKAGASTTAALEESIGKIIAEFEAGQARPRRAIDSSAMETDSHHDGGAETAQLVRYGQSPSEQDMQVALPSSHSQEIGALGAGSGGQLLLRQQLVGLMVQATQEAREVVKQEVEKDFHLLARKIVSEVGNDWVKRVQEVGDEQGRLWLEKASLSGKALGDLWLQTIQHDGSLARDQWQQEIYQRGMQAGEAWVRETHLAGLSGGRAWIRDMHRAGLKLGQDWVKQIHHDGLSKSEAWALDIQKAGIEKKEEWAVDIQKVGLEKRAQWALDFEKAAREITEVHVQKIQRAGDDIMDQLSDQLRNWHASPKKTKALAPEKPAPDPAHMKSGANKPSIALEAVPVTASLFNQERNSPVISPNEQASARIAELEAQIKIAELEAKLAAARSSKASTSTADHENTSGATVTTSASHETPKEFVRDKDTPLRIPEGREAQALEIHGVEARDSVRGGQYLCMKAGEPLLPAQEFWNEKTHTEYKTHLGQPTFTRDVWTEMDVKPIQVPEWNAIKKLPGVIEVNNDLGHKLMVPKDVDLLPTIKHWPKQAKDDYVNKDEPKSTVTQWTKLYIPEGDTAAWERAEALPGVRRFSDGGREGLAVPPDGDVGPSKRAGFVFSRSEWTVLKVDKKDWDDVKKLPDVREFTKSGEKVLAVRPQGNALFAKNYWPEEIHKEYESRDNHKFNRKGFTELTPKPGTEEFKKAKEQYGLKPSKYTGKLLVPPEKDLLPYKPHWPEGVKKDYEAFQRTSAERERGRNERAKAVGR